MDGHHPNAGGSAERKRAMRERRKQEGLCVDCGTAPLVNATHCAACRELSREDGKARQARLQAKRVSLGLCRSCGKQEIPAGRVCEECRAKLRNQHQKHREERVAGMRERAASLRAQGLCSRCGAHPSPSGVPCKACKDAHKEWRDGHRELIRTRDKASRERDRDASLTAYGGHCTCCGESRREFLTIDHINGDGAAHRKEVGRDTIHPWLRRHGYPPGFQVLCWNCNMAKHFYGRCPHQPPE